MTLRDSIQQMPFGDYHYFRAAPNSSQYYPVRYDNYNDAKAAQKKDERKHRFLVNKRFLNHTVQELFELHLDRCPYTKVMNRKAAVTCFLTRFGKRRINQVSKIDLECWLYDMALDRELSIKTIKSWATYLHNFFDFLVEDQIISFSPLRRIRFPSKVPLKRKRVVLTEDEIKKILENAKFQSPWYFYPIFLTLVHTGARRKEVINLKWEDIDFNMGTILFRKTKNTDDRVIHIPARVLELFNEMPRRSRFVFTCEEGLPIGISQLQWRLFRFQRLFPNGKNWAFHSFRHSFAHNFLKKGGNMYELQAILGHRTIMMTINLYGQLKAVEIENPSPYDF